MSDALTRLITYGDDLLTALRDEVKSKPITRFGAVNGSGRLAESLRFETLVTATGYQLNLYANGYVLSLIYGRAPGRFPPLVAIEQWILDKGIVPQPDSRGRVPSTHQLAYLIARKLAAKGNTVWQQGPPSALFGEKLRGDVVAADLAKLLLPVLVEDARTVLREAVAG